MGGEKEGKQESAIPVWVWAALGIAAKSLAWLLVAALFLPLYQQARHSELLPQPKGGWSFRFDSTKQDLTLVEYLVRNDGRGPYEGSVELVVEIPILELKEVEVKGVSLSAVSASEIQNDSYAIYQHQRPRLEPGEYFGFRFKIAKKDWRPQKVTLRRVGAAPDDEVTLDELGPPIPGIYPSLMYFISGIILGIGACGVAMFNTYRYLNRKEKAEHERAAGYVELLCAAIDRGVEGLSRQTQELRATQDLLEQRKTAPGIAANTMEEVSNSLKGEGEVKGLPAPDRPGVPDTKK